jgi:hypothetical protein
MEDNQQIPANGETDFEQLGGDNGEQYAGEGEEDYSQDQMGGQGESQEPVVPAEDEERCVLLSVACTQNGRVLDAHLHRMHTEFECIPISKTPNMKVLPLAAQMI